MPTTPLKTIKCKYLESNVPNKSQSISPVLNYHPPSPTISSQQVFPFEQYNPTSPSYKTEYPDLTEPFRSEDTVLTDLDNLTDLLPPTENSLDLTNLVWPCQNLGHVSMQEFLEENNTATSPHSVGENQHFIWCDPFETDLPI